MVGFVPTTMPRYSRMNATRPEGAADVEIISRLKINLTPTADLRLGSRPTAQNEQVRSWFGLHGTVLAANVPREGRRPQKYQETWRVVPGVPLDAVVRCVACSSLAAKLFLR